MESFLRYWFGGLIHGGGYFRNFTVCMHHLPKTTQFSVYTISE